MHSIWNTSVIKYTLKNSVPIQYVQQEKTMQEINMKNNMENQSINSPVFVYAKDSLLSVKRIALICPRAKMQSACSTVVEETLW